MADVLAWLAAHGLELMGAIGVVVGGLYAIALLIPGDIPDRWLKALMDITDKFSNKPKP